jgi:conjugative relaxase-like TrwC/TraI family protein
MVASIGKSVSADYYLKKARAQAAAGYYSNADNHEPDLYVSNFTSIAKCLPTGARICAAQVLVEGDQSETIKSGKKKKPVVREHPSAEQFRQLVAGINPDTGKPIRKLKKDEKSVLNYDLTLSLDKDLSNLAMAALAQGRHDLHRTIIQSAIEANAETLEWMIPKCCYSRQRRKNGEIKNIPGRPFIATALQHDARPAGGKIGMPQVHLQNVFMAPIQLPDGSFGALDSKRLYKWKHAIGAHFRDNLRVKLQERLGLKFEPHPTSGMYTLAGMDQALRAATSIRSKADVAQNLPQDYATLDKATQARIRDRMVIDTRERKSKSDKIDTRPRLEVWAEMYERFEFNAEEFARKNRLIEVAPRKAVVAALRLGPVDPLELAERALKGTLYSRENDEDFKPTTMFENEAFLTDAEVARVIGDAFAEFGIDGSLIGPSIQALIDQKKILPRLDPKITRLRPEIVEGTDKLEWKEKLVPGKGLGFVTPEQLRLEAELRAIAGRLHADKSGALDEETVRKRLLVMQRNSGKNADGTYRTRDEQIEGIIHLICKSGRISSLEGTAGSGKSWAVVEATKFFPSMRVLVAAISWEKSTDLHKEGVRQARWEESDGMALASLIAAYDRSKENPRSRGPKIDANTLIVVDEAGQVDSKTMLRICQIAEETGARVLLTGDRIQTKPIAAGDGLTLVTGITGFRRLDESVRMKLEKDKSIATLLSAGRADLALDLMDKNNQVHIDSTALKITERAVEDAFKYADTHPGQTAVLLARRNTDVRGIIEIVRKELIVRGEIGKEEITFAARTRFGGSELGMRVGEEVRFGRRYTALDVKNGTFGTILKIERGRKDDSARMTVRVHEGDDKFRDIEFDTADYQNKTGAMKLSYGGSRRIGVRTIYDSQGMTVDWAGHVMPGGVRGTGLSSAFVAHSRARYGTHLYLNEAGIKREIREEGEIGKSLGKLEVSREQIFEHVAKKFSAELRKVNASDTVDADPREIMSAYEQDPTIKFARPSHDDLAGPRPAIVANWKEPPRKERIRAARKQDPAKIAAREAAKAEKARQVAELRAQKQAERAAAKAERERVHAELMAAKRAAKEAAKLARAQAPKPKRVRKPRPLPLFEKPAPVEAPDWAAQANDAISEIRQSLAEIASGAAAAKSAQVANLARELESDDDRAFLIAAVIAVARDSGDTVLAGYLQDQLDRVFDGRTLYQPPAEYRVRLEAIAAGQDVDPEVLKSYLAETIPAEAADLRASLGLPAAGERPDLSPGIKQ